MSDCAITSKFENDILTINLTGRIDSTNASDSEKAILAERAANASGKVEIDAEKLEYISSAGLRILLKLQKYEKQKFLVKNVSPSVYEIFDVTGFVEILDVQKAMRKISIEGCPVIGCGATSTAYRLDPDTIVKVFTEDTNPNIIQQESVRAKNALKAGVQTAISFDVVQVGNRLGVIYELLNSKDLISCIANDKQNLKKYVADFASFVREMHSLEVDTESFPSSKEMMLRYLKISEGRTITTEEYQKMAALWEALPESNHFVHGDCHLGNVMFQDNELMFIDLAAIGSGHPIVDMTSMYFNFYFCPVHNIASPNSVLMKNFTKEEGVEIWNTFVSAYLNTSDQTLIDKVTEHVDALACSRIQLAELSHPGMFKKEEYTLMRNHAIAYFDKGNLPVCF